MLLGGVHRVEVLYHKVGDVVAVGFTAAHGTTATATAGIDAAALVAAAVDVYVETLQESVTDDSNFCDRDDVWDRNWIMVLW